MEGSPSTKVRVVTTYDASLIYIPRRGTTVNLSPRENMDVVFGSHAGRWAGLDGRLTEKAGLGPGSYVARGYFRGDNNESYSRRGLGSFASKGQRFAVRRADLYQGPGPGAHHQEKPAKTASTKLAIYTSSFAPGQSIGHQPLTGGAGMAQPGTSASIGPGTYDPPARDPDAPAAPVIRSSFVSSSSRLADSTKLAASLPGPGAYRAKVSIATVGELPFTGFKHGTGHGKVRSPGRLRGEKEPAVVGPPSNALDLPGSGAASPRGPEPPNSHFVGSLSSANINSKKSLVFDVPGPGSYDVPSSVAPPVTNWKGTAAFVPPSDAHQLRGRRKPKAKEASEPGPGAYYDPHRTSLKLEQGGAKSAFASQSARIQSGLTGTPGPAYYHSRKPKARSYHYEKDGAFVV